MKTKITIGTIIVVILAIIGAVGYTIHKPVPTVKGISNVSEIDAATAKIGSGCDSEFTTCPPYLSVDSSGNVALTGTTSLTVSYDGFYAYGSFTVATGTAKTLYTNSYGPLACSGKGGVMYAKSNGFSPAVAIGLGTSTSATGYSVNLLASTTIATTTTSLSSLLQSDFILASGESIVGAISDVSKNASSTYYGNWSIQWSLPCHLISG